MRREKHSKASLTYLVLLVGIFGRSNAEFPISIGLASQDELKSIYENTLYTKYD